MSFSQEPVGRLSAGASHRMLNLLYALTLTQETVVTSIQRGLDAQSLVDEMVSNRARLARGVAGLLLAVQELLESGELREQDVLKYVQEGDHYNRFFVNSGGQ